MLTTLTTYPESSLQRFPSPRFRSFRYASLYWLLGLESGICGVQRLFALEK